MARTGWSATDYLKRTTSPISTYPATLVAWARQPTIGGGNKTILCLHHSGSTSGQNAIILSQNDTLGAASAETSTSPTAGVWYHAAAVFASGTDRRAYLDAGGKVTNATSKTPSSAPDSVVVGAAAGSTVGNSFDTTAEIAEAAIWNVALTDADIAALAAGAPPYTIRPDALQGYWPILGVNSPEQNYAGAGQLPLTMTGSLTLVTHPRIFMPRRKGLIT
jgi:hypothetical protein